jgi:AcrR family transcriptional regulator
MQEADTATRIIRAAEALFAEQGFVETTMRQITSAAGVNLAAVNYHYGSKSGLIEAVAARFLDPLCAQLERMLSERQLVCDSRLSVEELIEILMRALLLVKDRNPHALGLFMRLLDLAYAPAQQELRGFLLEQYGQRVRPFVELVRQESAPMEADEFFWRLHFLLGALIFTLSNHATLSGLQGGSGDGLDIERTLHRMVPVLSAGFQARAESNWFCRV